MNIVLPDEFAEAPVAVSKALMMKTNLEEAVKLEVAQAEMINKKKESKPIKEQIDKSAVI